MLSCRILTLSSLVCVVLARTCPSVDSSVADAVFSRRTVVTDEAKGARCAVAADFDGDGLLDLVSASSTDNTVAWYRNDANGGWSGKNDITYLSNGARIVTTGDVDGDGDIDVVAASYYDDTIRWFENDGNGGFSKIHVVTTTAVNAQGVFAADLDADGDLDLVSASSGDNTVAVYINVDRGTFCELKRIVDDNAIGVRTVVAADLDGDGDLDLASASKDDNIVAWYPNDGGAQFSKKIVISNTSFGAYSLVARDIEGDGDMDLIVASNGDDTVALWRNDGAAGFTKTVIYAFADFVLSVTAFDFDRDGDLDVASASYFDGYVRWYENLDGFGSAWQNHTLYVGAQGHYVSTGDMDNDGDEDLISVTNSENRVQIFYASTACNSATPTAAYCRLGQWWNGTACVDCEPTTYGVIGESGVATCLACPSTCNIPGFTLTPATCSTVTGCSDASAAAALCDCAANEFKSNTTDTCTACPAGQSKQRTSLPRPLSSFAAETMWEGLLNECIVEGGETDLTAVWVSVLGVLALVTFVFLVYRVVKRYKKALGAERSYEQWLEEHVNEALAAMSKMGFSVCYISLSNIKKAGKLLPHEACRRSGDLVMLDTYDELVAFVKAHPTVFFSHQWLAKTEPDPDNKHFEALVTAAAMLCQREAVDPDNLYCWVDYACIPQANVVMKSLSISTIALYSSVCRFFVALCPTLQSGAEPTPFVHNIDSYQTRGWCRLEQWARLTVGGLKAMYMFDVELQDLSSKPEWYQDSIRVLSGDFTDPNDRRKLVPIILGLWASCLRNRHDGNDSVGVYELVKFNYNAVFPPEYFGSLVRLLEDKVDEEFNSDDEDETKSEAKSGTSCTPSVLRRGSTRRLNKRSDGDLFKAFKAAQGSTRGSASSRASSRPDCISST